MRKLLEICSNHPDPIHATRQWRRQAKGSVICFECNKVLRNRFPQPIDVVLREYPAHSIGGPVWWTGVWVFHLRFIEQIREHMTRFTFGRCLLEDGTVVEEYVTCYSRDYIGQCPIHSWRLKKAMATPA